MLSLWILCLGDLKGGQLKFGIFQKHNNGFLGKKKKKKKKKHFMENQSVCFRVYNSVTS